MHTGPDTRLAVALGRGARHPAPFLLTKPVIRMPAATAPRLPWTGPAGRHRRASSTGARIGRAAAVLSRLGSMVTLAALLVLAATVGGLVDGVPVAEDASVTVTFDGR